MSAATQTEDVVAETGPCPECGGKLPDDTIWFVGTKLYCSEKCARAAGEKQ